MANRSKSVADRTFPWFQSGFDLEGIVGFLAAWLLGILLGMLWGPLFWLAFIPGLVLLFATRTADRVTPEDPGRVFAPCDGLVVSIDDVEAPADLPLHGITRRIRISSSPFSSNNIHAPVAGTVDSVVREEGAAEAFAAMKADSAGLEVLYFAIGGEAGTIGLRVATGGLGPRLETRTDTGDRVVAGKTIGTRRLGGWCDVYMPVTGKVLVEPGRTLIGGETTLVEFDGDVASYVAPAPTYEDEAPIPDTVPPEVADDAEEDEPAMRRSTSVPPIPEVMPPEAAEEAEDEVDEAGEPETITTGEAITDAEIVETGDDEDDPDNADLDPDDPRRNDPAEMFARLRRKASRFSDDSDKD